MMEGGGYPTKGAFSFNHLHHSFFKSLKCFSNKTKRARVRKRKAQVIDRSNHIDTHDLYQKVKSSRFNSWVRAKCILLTAVIM